MNVGYEVASCNLRRGVPRVWKGSLLLRFSVCCKWFLVSFLIPLVLCLSVAGRAVSAEQSDAVGERLEQMIEPFFAGAVPAASVLELEGVRVPLHSGLVRFYRQRAYRPAWFHNGRISTAAWQWLERVQGVAAEGLNPRDYHVETLAVGLELVNLSQSYGEICDPGGLALVDILLTDSFLKYVSHLLHGRVDPSRFYAAAWQGSLPGKDAVAVLHQVLRQGQVATALEALVPHDTEYRRLAVYLELYRRLALSGGWPTLPDGPPLRPGQTDARVPLLRRFLVEVGDLGAGEGGTGLRFDKVTVSGLKRYQARHGLRPDGVLGRETLAQVNVPAARRIEQIALNLERKRRPGQDAAARYVQVDITDFTLTVVDKGREVMRMPVVVGTAFRSTPVFSALMRYLVFAPYWTVPPTILKEDKWPLIKANPNYLKAHHFEIVAWGKNPEHVIDAASINWRKVSADNFPGMLRQKPGPWNPLGKVKFMFPNAYHVYLHDTPSRSLFEKQKRTFSSGCIRIARPLELAVYLLEGEDGWTRERIKAEMEGDKPHAVRLPHPIPVYIVYRTAWVDSQGRLQFRNDVYEKDPELQAALQEQDAPSVTGAEMTSQVDARQVDARQVDGESVPAVRVVR